MRKILSLIFVALIISGCAGDSTGNSTSNFREPLVVGQDNQAGVSYNSDIESIDFILDREEGDSTFFVANLDLDGNNSSDIIFNLVKWSDTQILTLRSRNGVSIPFTSSDFEIIGTDITIPGLTLLVEGTPINSLVTNYQSSVEGFVLDTLGNMINTTAQLAIQNSTVYLPFASGTREGWVGIYIIFSGGVQIDRIGIDVIAIR